MSSRKILILLTYDLSSRQKSRVLISCKIPCIRSGWHNKT